MTKLLPKYQKGKNVIRIMANEGYQDVPISNHTYSSGTPLGYVIPEVTVIPSKQQQAQISRKQTAQAWKNFDKEATSTIYNGIKTAAILHPVTWAANIAFDPNLRNSQSDISKAELPLWALPAIGAVAPPVAIGTGIGLYKGARAISPYIAKGTKSVWTLMKNNPIITTLIGSSLIGSGVGTGIGINKANKENTTIPEDDSNYIYNESAHINDPDSVFIKSLQNLEIK
jgi:hypothetical protein